MKLCFGTVLSPANRVTVAILRDYTRLLRWIQVLQFFPSFQAWKHLMILIMAIIRIIHIIAIMCIQVTSMVITHHDIQVIAIISIISD